MFEGGVQNIQNKKSLAVKLEMKFEAFGCRGQQTKNNYLKVGSCQKYQMERSHKSRY